MSFACNGAAKKILMSVTLALGFGFACGACSCRPVATPSDGGFVPASLQIALQSGFDDVYDSVVSCAKTDWSSFEGWWCDEENATSEFIDVRGMHQIEIFFIDEEKVEFNVFDVGRYPSHRITGCFESVTGFSTARLTHFALPMTAAVLTRARAKSLIWVVYTSISIL